MYFEPVAVAVMSAVPLTVSVLSHFIHLPPAPLLVSVSVPPLMVMSRSALSPQAPFVSRSSSSQAPPPVVVTLMVPPLMARSPSAFTPLVAAAVVLTVSEPPSM